MVKQTEENLEAKIDICKTDSGYHSGDNLVELSKNQIETLIDDPTDIQLTFHTLNEKNEAFIRIILDSYFD